MTTSTQTQLRRGTASQCDAMTPVQGEVVYDTTNNRLRSGDGSRTGGYPVPDFSDVQANAFCAADPSGTGDAIVLTYTPNPVGWTKYMSGRFIAGAANTLTNPTLALTGVSGTKTIKKKGPAGPTALAVGDIQAGNAYSWMFDGSVVQIDGIDLQAQSGLTLLASRVASGGSTMAFTGLISSAYAAYELHIEDFKGSSASNLFLQGSINNGSSWLGSGNFAYQVSGEQVSGTPTSESYSSTSAGSLQLTGNAGGSSPGIGSGDGVSLIMKLNGMMSSTRGKLVAWDGQWIASSGSVLHVNSGVAIINNVNPVNALQLSFGAGNIASGKARLYGFAP